MSRHTQMANGKNGRWQFIQKERKIGKEEF
jgi:hypothetical protein